MAFRHGIFIEEVTTAIQPMLSLANVPVIVGTAPCAPNLPPNTAQIAFGLTDFKEKFGWSNDFANYTLCEVAYCFFTLFRVAPVIFVNSLYPTKHKKSGSRSASVLRGYAEISFHIVLSSSVVKSGETTLVKDTDYTASFNNSGNLEIRIKNK